MTNTQLTSGATIGIIGGGQLGRMTAMAAAQMGFHVHTYTPEQDSPAEEVAQHTTIAAYDDHEALRSFAKHVDVITVEFENIPSETATFLSALTPFFPAASLFSICQHRAKEKHFIRSCGAQTADYDVATTYQTFVDAVERIGTPCIAKHTTMGYDGKGQVRLSSAQECRNAWETLGGQEVIIEAMVPFACEASIIVARDQQGDMTTFPIARNHHDHGILARSTVPAQLSDETCHTMQELAYNVATKGELIGLLAIECFILQDGSVLVNEMAPRPHNSGHWTQDGCNVSQFEQLIRICVGYPLLQPSILHDTVMFNLIGDDAVALDQWLDNPHARLHLYGKHDVRSGRKMGHVNVMSAKNR